jgi:hypothetical protein
MRIDTSSAQFEQDYRTMGDDALKRIIAAGVKYSRTGTMAHRLAAAELKRRNIKPDVPCSYCKKEES